MKGMEIFVDCICWAGIVLAIIYFGPVCIRILAR